MSDPTAEPKADLAATLPEPIKVPISVNLPSSLAGKPLRLEIDIVFED